MPIVVHTPRQTIVQDQPTISAAIDIEGKTREVYICATRGPLTSTSDPFLALVLVPAMRLNLPVRVEGTVTRLLLDHVERVQDMLTAWWPDDMHKVAVDVDGVVAGGPEPSRVGSFFSGGIDSSYTALKHGKELDDLIFIHGFDLPLSDLALRELVAARLRQAARDLGKNLVEVETNLRIVLDPYANWNYHSHGAALGSVALALAPQMRRIYIAATFDYDEQRFHGSHPLLDPLWGHDTLEIVHDGCELSRWRKAERIIEHETVLRTLRVCWKYPRAEYNCGRCDSCTMNMIFLRATGMAGRCSTFPPLDLARIQSVDIPRGNLRRSYVQLMTLTQERMADPDLIEALRQRWQRAEDEGILPGPITPEMRRLQGRVASLEVDLRRATAELRDVQASRSWRLTRPLRALASVGQRLRRPVGATTGPARS